MALVNCHECGKEISDESKRCPHCGAKRKKKAGPIAWIIAGVFLLIVIMNVGNKESSESARRAALTPEQRAVEDSANRLRAARGACLVVLKQNLNDPDSAKFGSASEWYAKERKDGTIHVQPTGRAKNAFGAYINGTWDCIVKPEGANVRVLSLKQIRP